MTSNELSLYVGKNGLLSTTMGIEVGISIKDARMNFGRIHLLISPLDGAGNAWVSEERVRLEGGK